MGQIVDRLYQERVAAVRSEFEKWQVDGILIGSASNRRWLSGFKGSTGWLLLTGDCAFLGTDSRYWYQARSEAPDFELRSFRSGSSEAWAGFLDIGRHVRLGIEARHITLCQLKEFADTENVTFVELGQTLETFRQVKSNQELNTIRRAAAVTDAVMAGVPQLAQLGMTERQLAWELERRMRESGASRMAFPIIVAFGTNSAMAHHSPSERILQADDPVIIDMGAEVDGYASDLTRSFYVGAEPSARYEEVYNLVQKAQKAAIEAMRAGISGREVDSLARDMIDGGGYGEAFGHSLGHGLGLDIHEEPSLSQINGASPIRANSVVTVEPGIYLPDWGGVRIEDLVRITADGVDVISKCPKNPTITPREHEI